ncbi:MAG: hypothetical protein IT262_20485 [Saprospiraceae bacterium]|nr:hypothetical protein [Saprospiraceae bacterium]
MKMILQKVARQLSHTHTFCTVLLVSVMMAGSLGVKAQGGAFTFSSLSSPNTTTGMQRCTVSWSLHATPINAINVSFSFNVNPICVDIAATQATIPAVLAPFTNVTNSGITINTLGSTPINIAAAFSPFFVFHFRGEPATALTINGSGSIRSTSGAVFSILPSSKTVTFASGFSISGVAKKLEGIPCSNGMNNRITGVTFTVSQAGGSSCFPGSLPLSTSPAETYSFLQLPMSFNYNVTAAKSAGCECGLEGPVNNDDVNQARAFILGLDIPTLLEGHAGDYNANGMLTALDLVLMSQCYQGIPSVPSVWRFAAIANAGTFSNPLIPGVNPLPTLLPGSLNVPNLLSNKTVDFIGIKRGDVDQSCTECGSSLTGGVLETRSNAAVSFKGLSVSDISLEQGEEMLVPVVAAENLKGISVLGMEWQIGDQIELLDVQDVLTGEYSNFTTRQQGRQNVLHYTWFTMKDGGEDVASGEVLLYIRIKALENVTSLHEVLKLLPFSTNNKVFYSNGQSQAQWRLAEPDKDKEQLSVRVLGANQLTGTTAQVEIYLPHSGALQLVVSDMAGRVINTQSLSSLEKGWSLREIDVPDNAGIYQLTVLSPFGQQAVRLVKY